MLEVSAIKCPKCEDIIYSRARHDYHSCSCGSVHVDGGFDYLRCGWNPDVPMPKPFTLKVNATKQQLYNDWNRQEIRAEGKFGWIHPKKEKVSGPKKRANKKDGNPASAKAKPRKVRRSAQ